MANYYRDPTAAAVMGAIDKEISQKEVIANLLCEIRQYRPLSKKEERFARSQFRGIHRRFLKLALGE